MLAIFAKQSDRYNHNLSVGNQTNISNTIRLMSPREIDNDRWLTLTVHLHQLFHRSSSSIQLYCLNYVGNLIVIIELACSLRDVLWPYSQWLLFDTNTNCARRPLMHPYRHPTMSLWELDREWESQLSSRRAEENIVGSIVAWMKSYERRLFTPPQLFLKDNFLWAK